VLGDVAVDGALEIDDRVEGTALAAPLGQKKPSIVLSLDVDVGVKWTVKRAARQETIRPSPLPGEVRSP
jgi:hypothetical protein